MVFVASYPPGSVGMLRAATESGLKTRFFGGGMVGLQFTPVKQQFGANAQRHHRFDLVDAGADDAVPRHPRFPQGISGEVAGEDGVDPLGCYLPPFAYADLQVLGEAIEGDQEPRSSQARRIHARPPFKTIVGDISFGADGEWTKPRVLEVQWQGIKSGNVDDFKDTKTEVIIEPEEYRTGTVVEPFVGK